MKIHWNSTPRIMIARMGPIEAKPIRPNPSLAEDEFVRNTDATPTPSAKMKGTAIGPVVTPPASNEMETKASGTNMESRKTVR